MALPGAGREHKAALDALAEALSRREGITLSVHSRVGPRGIPKVNVNPFPLERAPRNGVAAPATIANLI